MSDQNKVNIIHPEKRDSFASAPYLEAREGEESGPIRCRYCGNTFSASTRELARQYLKNHVQRMREKGKGHGAVTASLTE